VREAGAKNRAHTETFENVTVSGGLQIDGTALSGTAQINGIEVWLVVAPPSVAASAGNRSSSRTVSQTENRAVPKSTAWARSDGGEWVAAPELLDGDPETLWIGDPEAASWSVTIDFAEVLPLMSLELFYEDIPWDQVGVMGTVDRLEWVNLDAVEDRPVDCLAIYLFFYGEGISPAPSIREIEWEEP